MHLTTMSEQKLNILVNASISVFNIVRIEIEAFRNGAINCLDSGTSRVISYLATSGSSGNIPGHSNLI